MQISILTRNLVKAFKTEAPYLQNQNLLKQSDAFIKIRKESLATEARASFNVNIFRMKFIGFLIPQVNKNIPLMSR